MQSVYMRVIHRESSFDSCRLRLEGLCHQDVEGKYSICQNAFHVVESFRCLCRRDVNQNPMTSLPILRPDQTHDSANFFQAFSSTSICARPHLSDLFCFYRELGFPRAQFHAQILAVTKNSIHQMLQ